MTVEIYMKSGNVLVLDHVKTVDTETKGDEVTRLRIVLTAAPRRALLVSTIALSQVEAVCARRSWWERLTWSK